MQAIKTYSPKTFPQKWHPLTVGTLFPRIGIKPRVNLIYGSQKLRCGWKAE